MRYIISLHVETLGGIGRDTAKAQKACEERVGEDYQGRERDIGSDSRRV